MLSKKYLGKYKISCLAILIFILTLILFASQYGKGQEELSSVVISVYDDGMKRQVAWAIDYSFLLLGKSLMSNEIINGLNLENKTELTFWDIKQFAVKNGVNIDLGKLTWENIVKTEDPVLVLLKNRKLGIIDSTRTMNEQVLLYTVPGFPGEWVSRNDIEKQWYGQGLILNRPKTTKKIKGPSALWKSLVYDFGTVGLDYNDEFVYEVHNTGREPLSLKIDNISCSCIKAKLDDEIIPPGSTSFLRLQADFTKLRGRQYSFTVLLSANDGQTYIARTFGQVLLSYNTSTKKIDFSEIAKGGNKTMKIHIYDKGTRDLSIKNAQILLDKDYQDGGIEASVEFIHWGGLTYTGDIMTDTVFEPGDYIALIKIKVAPDCSLETFKGSLVITLNQGNETNRLELPFNGNIVAR